MLEENSEKLTLNVGVVDLGKIDYLVSQGFYGNRTDFLRTAVKRQLDSHEGWLNREFIGKSIDIGVTTLTPSDLENRKYQDYVALGRLTVAPGVTLETMKKAFRKITVYGKVNCSPEIKEYYGL